MMVRERVNEDTMKNKAAFFDLDLTITDRDSFRLFLRRYYFRSIRSLIYVPYLLIFGILRKIRLISLQQFKEHALIGLRNKTAVEINAIANDFFVTHLKKTIRGNAVRQIQEHKQNGELVFIVSASPDIYVKNVAQYLNCDGYICSDLEYNSGKFSGLMKGRDCIGAEKMIRIEKLAKKMEIDLNNSFAYSDHEADLQFLEATGTPIVVTPTNNLRQIALTKNWLIECW